MDWRHHYHTFEDLREAPSPTCYIDGFLQGHEITVGVLAEKLSFAHHRTVTGCHSFHHTNRDSSYWQDPPSWASQRRLT